MNFREGTRRMRWLGMAMTFAPIFAWALYTLNEIQPYATHSGFGGFEYHFSRKIIAGAIVLTVPGAIVWASSWVLAGFGKDVK